MRDFIAAINHFAGVRCRIETSNGTRTPTVCVVRNFEAIRRARRAFAERLRDLLEWAPFVVDGAGAVRRRLDERRASLDDRRGRARHRLVAEAEQCWLRLPPEPGLGVDSQERRQPCQAVAGRTRSVGEIGAREARSGRDLRAAAREGRVVSESCVYMRRQHLRPERRSGGRFRTRLSASHSRATCSTCCCALESSRSFAAGPSRIAARAARPMSFASCARKTSRASSTRSESSVKSEPRAKALHVSSTQAPEGQSRRRTAGGLEPDRAQERRAELGGHRACTRARRARESPRRLPWTQPAAA